MVPIQLRPILAGTLVVGPVHPLNDPLNASHTPVTPSPPPRRRSLTRRARARRDRAAVNAGIWSVGIRDRRTIWVFQALGIRRPNHLIFDNKRTAIGRARDLALRYNMRLLVEILAEQRLVEVNPQLPHPTRRALSPEESMLYDEGGAQL